MARLIPKMSPDEIGLKPERDVARALVGQLPQDCIVYHSYPWLRAERNDRNRSDTLREGETDFVVVDPQVGILVLEVKGGEIEFDNSSHCWNRVLGGGGRREITDPFEQARRNTYFLTDQICRASFPRHDRPPCAFGYAVVFPDCSYSGPMPPGADNSIVLCAKDLPYLGRRIPEILRRWSRSDHPWAMTREELDGVVKGLSPSFRLLPVLFRQIEEQEEKLFRLTREQERILDVLRNQQRVAISGVAGSGKTLLARAQAERFAEMGKDTLLVCYNKSLAQWLSESVIERYSEKITIKNFHRLCYDFCREASVEFYPNDDPQEFWRHEAPDRLMQALDQVSKRFDAVVADEGQDFYPEWWLALEYLNREGEGGPLYVFFDPAQNLFVADGIALPSLGLPYELPTNCRNTKRIARLCSKILHIDISVHEAAPEGVECAVEIAPTASDQEHLSKKYVSEWITRGHLSPSQVVILGAHKKAHSSLANVRTLNKIPITQKLKKWEDNEAILYSTIRGFKGLEADAVVMVDIPKPGTEGHFNTTELYVGCSRAKHLLAVLAKKEGVL